jgi:hypothetical protein
MLVGYIYHGRETTPRAFCPSTARRKSRMDSTASAIQDWGAGEGQRANSKLALVTQWYYDSLCNNSTGKKAIGRGYDSFPGSHNFLGL